MLVDITPVTLDNLHLVDKPTLNIERFREYLEKYPTDGRFHRIQQGVYETNTWNPEMFIVEKLEGYSDMKNFPRRLTKYELTLPKCDKDDIQAALWKEYHIERQRRLKAMRRLYSQRYQRNWPHWDNNVPSYGVSDYPTQVLERYPHVLEDDVRRVLMCVEVCREDQSPSGGWRYHKWGEYIGRQRPRSEYLYDDKHIDSVWTWHFYEVKV